MHRYLYVCLILSISTFYGCASTPQAQFNVSPGFWENKEQKIGVFVSDIPEVKGHITGAACLLCLATASAINSSLNQHMQAQSSADLQSIGPKLIEKLQARGVDATKVKTDFEISRLKKFKSKAPNTAKIDFTPLKQLEGFDKVLVVDIQLLGSVRKFANYVPVGEPYAILKGLMYIVDLNTNQYQYFENINLTKFSDTQWDEENYPGMTNAYYTVVELGKQQILDLEVEVPGTVAATQVSGNANIAEAKAKAATKQ